MAYNVIIYPSGTTGISSPHIVYEGVNGSENGLIYITSPGVINFSASTNPTLLSFDNSNVTTTGVTVTNAPSGVWVGGQNMINSSGVWIGPQTNIKGSQGATGNTGAQGATGNQGAQGN